MNRASIVDIARRFFRTLLLTPGIAGLLACASQQDRSDLQLPQGDATKGREAFVELRCHFCHELEGFDPPTPIVAQTPVLIGGPTTRIETYGDLVTSIANPAHQITRGYPREAVAADGVPLMTLIRLNEVMTVQQLVDVAAFLSTAYDVATPPSKTEGVFDSDDAGALSQ